MIFYNQQDVLRIIKEYDVCDELLADLLDTISYNENDIIENCSTGKNVTNINFFCDKDYIKEVLKEISKNNDGKIIISKGVNNERFE